jgi:hypothetical protein
MQLTKVAAVLSLFIALGIGIVSVYIADSRKEVSAVEGPAEIPITAPEWIRLLGTWTGKFGHNLGDCIIEINRIDGNNFYGTLTKGGAQIALAGTLDRNARKVSIRETKVLSLGDYDSWSLGEDTAVISTDGFSMNGTGYDERGGYGWNVSHVKFERPDEE